MNGRTGGRRTLLILALLALAGARTLSPIVGGNVISRLAIIDRALAQPDRGLRTSIPGEAITPPPTQFPGDRPDRWLLPPNPLARPTLEADGTIEAIDGSELRLVGAVPLATGPATAIVRAPLTIDLAGDTTYFVEGVPTTFDRVPAGAPAQVTYEYQGNRRVALRVEAFEDQSRPAMP